MGNSLPFPHRWCRHRAIPRASAGTDCGLAVLAGAISAAASFWWWQQQRGDSTPSFSNFRLMDRRVDSLEEAVSDLQDEVRFLRGELRRVRRSIGESYLDPPGAGSAGHSRGQLSGIEESEVGSTGSYSLVDGSEVGRYSPTEAASLGASPTPERSVAAPSSVPRSVASVPRGRCSLTWAEREAICGEIAEFLVRCQTGQLRGTSGRDKINLPSRVWLVCRDFEGRDYNPVLIYKVFTLCKDLVKRGSECGQSIFVGLPSEREARFVVALAGLSWPEQ